METYSFDKSYEMFEQAKKYVPNGIYGPRSPLGLTFGSYPCFLVKGKGSHIWDVDGNEYIDYMCSFGTNVIGLCNEEVDAAARDQMERGDAFTLPSNRWNEMAEYLVNLIHGQDWTAFAKNGSDVTTYATTVARGYTGKNKVIVANGGYHGAHFWCSHATYGIPVEYKAHILRFDFTDLEQLRALVAENKGDVAALMLTPHHHPAGGDQWLPDAQYYAEIKKICEDEKMLLIFDDIRCGFRLDIHGSHVYYGADPDMICFGKAMANGYPIAAITGKEYLKEAAANTFFTGTHFFSAVPMAASLACMKIIERDGIIPKIFALGTKLQQGMEEQARSMGLEISYTGHPAMPFMRFIGDDDFSRNRFFCGEAAKRGVFLHPHHNWFVSGAHTEADIDRTLQVTEECFRLTKEQFYK